MELERDKASSTFIFQMNCGRSRIQNIKGHKGVQGVGRTGGGGGGEYTVVNLYFDLAFVRFENFDVLPRFSISIDVKACFLELEEGTSLLLLV